MKKYFYVCTDRRSYTREDVVEACTENPLFDTFDEALDELIQINDDCDWCVCSIDDNGLIRSYYSDGTECKDER